MKKFVLFDGNKVSNEIKLELESYFSADEVKALQNRIKSGKEQIANLLNEISEYVAIKVEEFFPDLIEMPKKRLMRLIED